MQVQKNMKILILLNTELLFMLWTEQEITLKTVYHFLCYVKFTFIY